MAVILAEGDGDFWAEKMRLADLTYDLLVETGAHVQGWPVLRSDWLGATATENPKLIENMRRDARLIETAK